MERRKERREDCCCEKVLLSGFCSADWMVNGGVSWGEEANYKGFVLDKEEFVVVVVVVDNVVVVVVVFVDAKMLVWS